MSASNGAEIQGEGQPSPGRGQLGNEKRTTIVQTLLERSKDKVLRKGAVKEVASQF